MEKRLLVGLGTGIFALCLTGMANAAPIDLSSWSQWGPSSNGNWEVSADHTNVLQKINGDPTYFVSSADYSNTTFNGSFGVETTGDDDFIGFIFGATDSNNFFLFDWKQADQWGASEGFTLSQVSGTDVDFWNHTGSDITVLETDYGSTKGWADNTVYDFTLDYTTTSITIAIDGANIFSLSGMSNNPDGKFGFYNYSQSYVRYQGFEQNPSSVPEPATMLLFGSGLVGLVGFRRRKSNR